MGIEPESLASRPSRSSAEAEFLRHFGTQLSWQRAPAEPSLDEPQASFDSDIVDDVASDQPPEVDFEQLPRWMRAVPEQGPPDELEFEAGSGPADDWE